MLARTAFNLYWLARYLQRCELTARFLSIQVETLVDKPILEIQFGWERMYRSLDRALPQTETQDQNEDELPVADSLTLCDDLTFSKTNTDAIWACFEQVRENARQVRYCITEEVWASINLTYLAYRGKSIVDVWEVSPQEFYADFARDVQSIEGVAQATMYRDDGWYFYQMGSIVEQAQHMCSMLIAHLEVLLTSRTVSTSTWSSLLRGYYAKETYAHVHGMSMDPRSVFNMLVFDSGLPCSLNALLKSLQSTIASIGGAPNPKALQEINGIMFSLATLVSHVSSGIKANVADLRNAQGLFTQIHDQIFNAWIGYTVDDTPVA